MSTWLSLPLTLTSLFSLPSPFTFFLPAGPCGLTAWLYWLLESKTQPAWVLSGSLGHPLRRVGWHCSFWISQVCPSLGLWLLSHGWFQQAGVEGSHGKGLVIVQTPHLFQGSRNTCHYAVYTEKAMAPHSSTLAWKIPWTEEPGGLQSMGSLQFGHDWATSLSLFTFMHWRRKWQPTPVFLPGESQGRGSLVGCHLWGCTELDTTEAT